MYLSKYTHPSDGLLEKRNIGDYVDVTAAPKYDIYIGRNTSTDILGWYNTRLGTVTTDQKNADDIYGRLEGYPVAVRVVNDSPEKGLKGIELPSGNISFSIKMSSTVNGRDVTYDPAYKPFLWDYKMNTRDYGALGYGRTLTPLGQLYAAWDDWQSEVPYNAGGGEFSCYNGGRMVVNPDENDSTLLHVVLTGYEFDVENFTFPERDFGHPQPFFPANVGFFSVGYLTSVCRFPQNVQNIENILFGLNVRNFLATSLSGTLVSTETTTSNNTRNITVTTYPKGTHTKRNFFYDENRNQIAQPWDAANSYAYAGGNVTLCNGVSYGGDLYLSASNLLQKIDDKVLYFPENTTNYDYCEKENLETDLGNVKMLFAAKPDKTGWSSEAEMNATREEELIYFKSIKDLNRAGYRCVGYLYEVRNCRILAGNGGSGPVFQVKAGVYPDVPSGTVASEKNDVRSWNYAVSMNFSWTDVVYDSSIGAYGLGNSNWQEGTYTNGYTTPTYTAYLDYYKAIYEHGTIVGGHTYGYQGGNSLLVITSQVGVNITPNDKTETGVKTIYDLDKNERDAVFLVTPTMKIDSANTDANQTNMTDNVKITVTLPKDLHFNLDKAERKPDEQNINSDGSATLVYRYSDIPISQSIQPFEVPVIIGEEGTVNDVQNNQNISITATIFSDNDQREMTAVNGKKSTASISVIRLSDSSVIKRAQDPVVETGEPFRFRLRISNLSDSISNNNEIYDVLPFTGDENGSSFSGNYLITSIEADYSHAPQTLQNNPNQTLRYSESAEAKNSDVRDSALKNHSYPSHFIALNRSGGGITAVWNINKPITAFALSVGNLYAKEYIDVYITCSPVDDSKNYLKDSQGTIQQGGDVYLNKFYQNSDSQVAVVISNIVETKVVSRNISGVLWEDTDKDGIREEGEPFKTDINVSLYRTTPSGFDTSKTPVKEVNGTPLYKAYKTNGQEISSTVTNANGEYLFTGVESGEYVVMASGSDDCGLTKKDSGTDDTLDSDGTLNGNVKDAEWVFINDIIMPDKESITSAEYTSEHNDIGYTPPQKKKVPLQKEWDDGNDHDGSRPEEITVSLINADGTEIENTFGIDDGWKTEYTTNAYYRGRDNEIDFSEDKVPLYTGSVSRKRNGGYTLTNKHLPSIILETGGKGLATIVSISALFAGISILLRQRKNTSK